MSSLEQLPAHVLFFFFFLLWICRGAFRARVEHGLMLRDCLLACGRSETTKDEAHSGLTTLVLRKLVFEVAVFNAAVLGNRTTKHSRRIPGEHGEALC